MPVFVAQLSSVFSEAASICSRPLPSCGDWCVQKYDKWRKSAGKYGHLIGLSKVTDCSDVAACGLWVGRRERLFCVGGGRRRCLIWSLDIWNQSQLSSVCDRLFSRARGTYDVFDVLVRDLFVCLFVRSFFRLFLFVCLFVCVGWYTLHIDKRNVLLKFDSVSVTFIHIIHIVCIISKRDVLGFF